MEVITLPGPVVVKTCREYIGQGFKRRKGMFRMDAPTHEELVQKDGYYLFGVEMINLKTQLKTIKANEVQFKYNITWTTLFP